MGDNQVLDKFVADILEQKELSGMTEEAKSYLLTDLKDNLMNQINKAIISELSESKLAEFNALLDNQSATEAQVQQFISESGVDVQKVVARTALAFRELYLQKASNGGETAAPAAEQQKVEE